MHLFTTHLLYGTSRPGCYGIARKKQPFRANINGTTERRAVPVYNSLERKTCSRIVTVQVLDLSKSTSLPAASVNTLPTQRTEIRQRLVSLHPTLARIGDGVRRLSQLVVDGVNSRRKALYREKSGVDTRETTPQQRYTARTVESRRESSKMAERVSVVGENSGAAHVRG